MLAQSWERVDRRWRCLAVEHADYDRSENVSSNQEVGEHKEQEAPDAIVSVPHLFDQIVNVFHIVPPKF